MNQASEGGARLERALEVFLHSSVSTDAEAAALLESHADLRDLLEPMLRSDATAEDGDDERVLGDFRLIREIGRGGMGVVHEAWQRSLDRRVAVKVLSAGAFQQPSAVARFRREATAAAKLRHPNIVEVIGFGTAGDVHYFAMPFITGGSLLERRAEFRSLHQIVDLAERLVDGLAHAHAHGLVHRDVKPANVLLREDSTPLLSDFGVASDEGMPSLTREGGFVGTLDYASPEQVRGEPVDARTDVWAVGVMLHELATEHHPFAAATQQGTIHNILTREPSHLRELRIFSRDLAAVVLRALEKDPRRRYADADALLRDLRALQHGHTVSARLPSALERALRWGRREPWRAAAASVSLIALVSIAAFAGYVVANAPRLRAAAAADAERSREELLAEAWWAVHEATNPQAGIDLLAAAGDDSNLEVAVSRAMMLFGMGRFDDARSALQGFAGESVEIVRTSIERPLRSDEWSWPAQPDAFAHFVLAELLYLAAGRRDELGAAAATERSALRAARLAVVLSPTPRLNHLITWLRTADAAGDRDALRDAERALARHYPASPVAERRRAQALSVLDPARALELLASPDRHAIDPGRYWSLRGVAFEKLGRLDEAIDANRRAVEAAPDFALGWHNLCATLRKHRDYADAVAAGQRAVDLAPTNAVYHNTLGLALRSAGDLAAAQRAFERALAISAGYAAAAYNLGNLFVSRSDHVAAASAFQRAIDSDASDPRYHANLGHALAQSGHGQLSLSPNLRAAMLAPGDLIPQYNLARGALDLGLTELALHAARRARALDERGGAGPAILAEALLAQPSIDAAAALAEARLADRRFDGANLHAKVMVARALEASGDRRGAIALLEATRSDPRFANNGYVTTLEAQLARMRAAE